MELRLSTAKTATYTCANISDNIIEAIVETQMKMPRWIEQAGNIPACLSLVGAQRKITLYHYISSCAILGLDGHVDLPYSTHCLELSLSTVVPDRSPKNTKSVIEALKSGIFWCTCQFSASNR